MVTRAFGDMRHKLGCVNRLAPSTMKKVMGILDKGGKGDFMKVHNVVMKALG